VISFWPHKELIPVNFLHLLTTIYTVQYKSHSLHKPNFITTSSTTFSKCTQKKQTTFLCRLCHQVKLPAIRSKSFSYTRPWYILSRYSWAKHF